MGVSLLGVGLIVLVGVPLGIALLVYLVVPVCKGIGWVFAQVFRFIFGEVGDCLRIVGSLLTTLVFIPLTVGNIIIGRWSASSHYGRAIQTELKSLGACLYRIAVGHPAKLFCLTAMTEGIEKRIPQVVAAAPGADAPSRWGKGRAGQFEGYNIVGSLAGGGSGGKLYIANPFPEKLASFQRAGIGEVKQVVIKSFSLRDGSSLPQIVRENRALPAAKRLNLILEHELTDERFYYVMRYVPGESLGLVTQRLHVESGSSGLAPKQLREAVEFASDIARTLCHYHQGGLWHKDVKPDNIIVSSGQAHLVDFGLITPLRSSMTLTTHGTEYFRDPEMVRMALRGVKVHEVDGAKFDIYAAGAVLYSMIENSFPAHGGLSQISKRCPEALRWIVRRAMTDYDKRYESAGALLADLEAVASAPDPFALKPAMLPSFAEGGGLLPAQPREWEAAIPEAALIGAAMVGKPLTPADAVRPAQLDPQSVAPRAGSPRPAGSGGRLTVTNWWTGRYSFDAGAADAPAPGSFRASPRVPGATAAEQLARARDRARAAQARAHQRMRRYSPETFRPINLGVGIAVMAFLVLVGGVVFLFGMFGVQRNVSITQRGQDGLDRQIHVGPNGIYIGEPASTEVSTDPAVTEVDFSRMNSVLIPADVSARSAQPRGEVMILRDPGTFTSAAKEHIDHSLETMHTAGFKLRGNIPASAERSEAETQTNVEYTADLRNELGILPFDSPEARQAILSWLDKHPQIQFVLWLGRGETSGANGAASAEPLTWLVGRRDAPPELLKNAAEVFASALPAAVSGKH